MDGNDVNEDHIEVSDGYSFLDYGKPPRGVGFINIVIPSETKWGDDIDSESEQLLWQE